MPGLDDNLYTVMSYNNAGNQSFPAGYPSTPMVLDIEAIQYIYGPNLSFHTGNDVYTLSDNKQLRTIWDAGGNDALDARSLDMGATIDLREGGFSNHGSADSWTAIAYGVTIERAFGSSFDDDIFGNESANRIDGASGADRIFGGGGNDVLIGNRGSDFVDGGTGGDQLIGGFASDVLIGRQGADRYVFAAGDGADRISEGGDSNPTILDTVVVQDIAAFADVGFSRSGDGLSLILDLGGGDSVVLDRHFSQAVQRVERLELSDGATLVLADGLTGGAADGVIVGTDQGETLDGGGGDDFVFGNGGDDFIIGRAGNPAAGGGTSSATLDGGPGRDTVSYQTAATGVIVNLDTRIASGAGGTDTLISIEVAVGSNHDDAIAGDGAANRLDGGAGRDTLQGGGGNDLLMGRGGRTPTSSALATGWTGSPKRVIPTRRSLTPSSCRTWPVLPTSAFCATGIRSFSISAAATAWSSTGTSARRPSE